MEDRFNIRVWDPEDEDIIPQFLEVFKSAFGSPHIKNKNIFFWKHRDNPAGLSIISYARDTFTDRVVAVRTLVPRKLFYNYKIYLGFEACEASTHPDYRRQGLFVKLMQNCIEIAEEQGGCFLIGYPNFNSKRGYLKVGCKDIGGIEVLVRPLNLLKVAFLFVTRRKNIRSFNHNATILKANSTIKSSLPHDLEEIIALRKHWRNLWAGYRDRRFLEYRFLSHPYHTYQVINCDDGFAFVLLGQRDTLIEGTIVEVFLRVKENYYKKAIKNLIRHIIKQLNIDFISIVLSISHPYYKVFVSSGFIKAPSNVSFYRYSFNNCPDELKNKPWAIIGTDIDTQ